MDKKALDLLSGFHKKFSQKTFLEEDVYGFLILIREYLSDRSMLRELCHFVAHRNRDRGDTVEQLKTLINYIEDNHRLPAKNINVLGLYPYSQITSELNTFLKDYGFSRLEQNTINDMILCMMSIMQNIPLKKNDVTLGEMSISLFKNSIGLYVSIDAQKGFTVYTPNGQTNPVYFQVPIIVMYAQSTVTNDGYCFKDKPIRIERINGRLAIMFEEDAPHS